MGLAFDYTEKAQQKKKLKMIGENYKNIFTSMGMLFFVLDLQGNIIEVNDVVIMCLGFTKKELIGKSVLLLNPKERRDDARCMVSEMLSGTSTLCTVPFITKTGVQIPVETKVVPGIWDDKQAYLGITKDISEQKNTEEAFAILFNYYPIACCLNNIFTAKYLDVNASFCSLFGFNKNEVLGKTAIELGILTAEAKEVISKKAKCDGNIENIAADLRAKNGEIKKVLLSEMLIKLQNKTVNLTCVMDLTKSHMVEESRSKLLNCLSLASKADGVGIWEYDVVNNILIWDDKMLAFYGMSRKKFGGKIEEWQTGVFPEDQKRCYEEFQMALRGEKEFNTEFRILCPNGKTRYLRSQSIVARDAGGKPL